MKQSTSIEDLYYHARIDFTKKQLETYRQEVQTLIDKYTKG